MKKAMVITDEPSRQAVIGYISAMAITEATEVKFKPYEQKRLDVQNALMWVWNGQWGLALGYTKDEIHDANKRDLLLPLMMQYPEDYPHAAWVYRLDEQRPGNWDSFKRMISTTDLSVKHFAEYLTDMEHKSHSQGVQLFSKSDEYALAVYGARKRA